MDYTRCYEATYDLALDRAAVNGEVAEVSKQFLRTVLALNKPEEFRCVVDELRISNIQVRQNIKGEADVQSSTSCLQ